LTLFPF
jgi:ribonuclease HI